MTMTLTDPAEGRAWAVWLLDHEPGLIPRRPAISYARARARPRWGQYGSRECVGYHEVSHGSPFDYDPVRLARFTAPRSGTTARSNSTSATD